MSPSVNESGESSSAAMSADSPSNTRARPVNFPSTMPRSTPATFRMAPPSGARLPCSRRRPPVGLNGPVDRVHDLAVGRRRVEPLDLLGERLAGARERRPVERAGCEQLLHDDGDAADRVDVDHRVRAERAHVHEHREPARELVELLLADHVGPEVEAGGAGDLGAVEHDVGGATHRHHHDERVAHRRRGDDVARADAGRA